MSTIDEVMAKLAARCGHSNHTSETVFAVEIDPAGPDSKLRNQNDLLESFCAQGSFTADWSHVLENRITAEVASDDEVEQLRGTIHPDPGAHDVSLIVAALKRSTQTGRDCIIVTDDMPLSNRISALRRDRREVFLGAHQYSTTRLTAQFSLEILRELYVKCGIDHEFWNSAMLSFKIHYNGHQGPPGRKHHQIVVDFLRTVESDRQEKESLCTAQEFDEIFGAENG